MQPDNNLILKRIKDGDIRAFEVLFRQYYEALCRYGVRFVGSIEESEEIVQELFYRIWKNRENIEISFSVKAYLFGAVKNNALQHLEHEQVKQNYFDQELKKQEQPGYLGPDEELEIKELNKQLDLALGRLSDRQREIFSMSRFEGLKYTEIAGKLGLSVKTIEAEITKSLKELRKIRMTT